MKRLFPSLPDNAGLRDVFARFPESLGPLLAYHDRVLRDDSPLSVAERELIAAYVSSLNACDFCLNGHTGFARAFGIPVEVIEAVVEDVDSAPIDPKLKPLLAYVAKLTRTPTRMTEADAVAVYNAGWDERALFDAIQVCALFNLMNRIVEGTGATTFAEAAEDLDEDGLEMRRSRSYSDLARAAGVAV